MKAAVDQGAAESQNAFVERALVRELRELRRQRVYEAYAEAAADASFMEDMRSTALAYDVTSSEGFVRAET
ncbi:MAG: hypothetical protein ACREMQ_13960 [Longimicrobiales bacterium]